MKTVSDTLRSCAISNAISSIKKEARLPANVFVQAWDDYLFFDPYIMFDKNFIEAKNIILSEEGSFEIAVINLGNASSDSDLEPRIIFLDKNTTSSQYLSILKGDGSPFNWMFLMDRYVCASDKGSWCIYCEKENDIAVLAIRHTFATSTLLSLRNLLKADSIENIYDSKIDHLFNFDKLVPSWKAALAADYGR